MPRWVGRVSVGAGAVCLAAALCGSGALPAQAAPRGSAVGAAAAQRHVIVLLRNQHAEAPAAARSMGHRAQLTAADQAPLVARARGAGGRDFRQLHVANAFAATVSASEAAALAADPAVAAVVPDQLVRAPGHQTERPVTGAAGSPASSTVCPASPDRPLLEPEALQATHTAFDDPTVPSGQQVATGRGVKVAFLADGLDIDNPDFIRPDGSHVFVDYQDFTGDGPDAFTGGAEAFGDASSIAAQGRQSYDLADFVNPAHPLPAGCTIRVLGMAPGASLVGLKVFPAAGFAAISGILAALDWAVTHDHVDVVSESFSSNTSPDTNDDAIAVFNEQLVRAGVTVAASSGDAGPGNTIGSPASSPGVISVGATTTFRSYAQTTGSGIQLANGRYRSGGISGLSSSGVTQPGRTLDLVAPGDNGWALCTPDLDRFASCSDNKGDPTGLQEFSGTSQSTPLTAGAAALVIQAYRDSHGGATPAPELVRRLLTSTADDLGLPAAEQGAGLLDTARAVRAARSASGSTDTASASNDLLVGPQQLDLVSSGGAAAGKETVTNLSDQPRVVHATVRSTDTVLATATQDVAIDLATAPTFVDAFGTRRAYAKTSFSVPAGAGRVSASVSWPGSSNGSVVRIVLLDPEGTYSAFSRPQGSANFGTVDVPSPAPGKWTAILWTAASAFGFDGTAQLSTTSFGAGSGGTVTPAQFTLPAHGSRAVSVQANAPGTPGDTSDALVLSSSASGGTEATSAVPVVVRRLVTLDATGRATVHGSFGGGNGRASVPNPAQSYDVDVPAGARDLSVGVTVTGDPGQVLYGFLVSPEGEPVAVRTNQRDGSDSLVGGMQFDAVAPQAGRWRLVFEVFGPVAGTATVTPYTATFALNAASVSTTGLPTGGVLPAGKPVTATVSFTNTGAVDAAYFADARLDTRGILPLVVANPEQTLEGAPTGSFPSVRVPTQSDALTVSAHADGAINFDLSTVSADHLADLTVGGDPDRLAGPAGTAPAVTVTGSAVAPMTWLAVPGEIGPFTGPAPTVHATFTGSVHTRLFDPAASSATGDPLLSYVDASAPAATPLTVGAGAHASITVTITPAGTPGTVVHGVLYLDTLDALTGSTAEIAAIPYTYTIG